MATGTSDGAGSSQCVLVSHWEGESDGEMIRGVKTEQL